MDNTLDILAHTGDAVCAVNNQQRVVYWNETAAKMLGIAAEEANGQLCWKLMKGKTVDGKPFCSSDCPIKAKLGSQEPVPHFDLWIKHKDNKRILANFSTIMIPQQNGQRQPDQAAIIHLIRAVKSQDHSQYDLRVNMLGPLEVWRPDGTQVGGKFWRRAKVRSLFVILALKQSQPIAREELIAALWPECDRPTALRNLNTTIYNLRRSLEPKLKQGNESNYIFYESGYYWLGGSRSHRIDAEVFELGIQQARLETAVDQASHLYREATALYRGDYLIDLTTNLGFSTERTKLRQLFLNALEELGSLYQQQEQPDQARDTYLRILALDPSRESACQQLTRLSYGSNTLTDNVAYCQRLAASLKDELDLLLSQDWLNSKES